MILRSSDKVFQQTTRYSDVVLSRNTRRKFGSNGFEKITGRVRFRLRRQAGRSRKNRKKKKSHWAENLGVSNKGLLLRPGAMAEGVIFSKQPSARPNATRWFPHQHLVQGD